MLNSLNSRMVELSTGMCIIILHGDPSDGVVEGEIVFLYSATHDSQMIFLHPPTCAIQETSTKKEPSEMKL